MEETTEQIAKHYSAALDSVNLIKELKSKETLSEEELDTINRNIDHLKIMLNKSFWTTEDLEPFQEAIKE